MAEAEYGKMLMWGGASVLLCAVLHALFKFFHSLSSRCKPAPDTTSDISVNKPEQDRSTELNSESGDKPTKQKKRPTWKGKSDFSHPWIVKSLKGHTGAVLHMDISSNGKYLASACEDSAAGKPPLPAPAQHLPRSLLGAPPPTLHGAVPLAVLTMVPPPPTALVRASPSPPQTRRSPPPPRNRKTRGRRRTPSPVSPPRMSTEELAAALQPYLLTRQQMLSLGYPVETEPNSSKASFYVSPPPRKRPITYFSVHAPEFVPGNTPDSGHGSGNVSPPNDSDEEHDPGAEDHACVRCDSVFRIGGDGKYLTKEHCLYHWGRPCDGLLTCCGKYLGSEGCSYAKYHVWSGTKPGLNGPVDGYVRARARRGGVFSIDTEMCYTTKGLELVSVAFVRPDGQIAYKVNVKPANKVVCPNTRFSGVRGREIERASKTLRDVQNDILGFVGADTVLVGHALENDLRALKLLHTNVVDTCALYPHERGFPLRRSLKALSAELLRREVQVGTHSPVEDARAALDLVLLRANADRAAAAAES